MPAITRKKGPRVKKKPAGEESKLQQCNVEKGGRRCPRLFTPGKTGAKGMCSMHYARARKNDGDPGDPEPEQAGPKKDVGVRVWTTAENAKRWKAAAEKAGAEDLSPWCEEQINAAIS